MGQCGCGDLNAVAAYDLSDDKVIVVDEYHGCHDCGTPLGFTLHLFSKEEAEKWLLSDQKPTPLRIDEPREEGLSQRSFPFVGRNELVEAAKEIEEENPISEYNNLSDWMYDNGLRLLRAAMEKREWKPGFKG
jgi:hypothetical protein